MRTEIRIVKRSIYKEHAPRTLTGGEGVCHYVFRRKTADKNKKIVSASRFKNMAGNILRWSAAKTAYRLLTTADTAVTSPGEDGLHHLQHVCSTFAADAAKNRNADSVPAGETDTVSSCVQEDRSCFAADLENTQTPPIGENDGGVWVCDPAICCKQNENQMDCIGI